MTNGKKTHFFSIVNLNKKKYKIKSDYKKLFKPYEYTILLFF